MNDLQIIENVLVNGDLGQLAEEDRLKYYSALCQSLGLNPLTKPFEYLKLQGKTILYARAACADQLRQIRKVSVESVVFCEKDGILSATVKVRDSEGRTDVATGVVSVGHLKGEAKATAVMKCETKAKRRATLSLCGLGMIDESDAEMLKNEAKIVKPEAKKIENKKGGMTGIEFKNRIEKKDHDLCHTHKKEHSPGGLIRYLQASGERLGEPENLAYWSHEGIAAAVDFANSYINGLKEGDA